MQTARDSPNWAALEEALELVTGDPYITGAVAPSSLIPRHEGWAAKCVAGTIALLRATRVFGFDTPQQYPIAAIFPLANARYPTALNYGTTEASAPRALVYCWPYRRGDPMTRLISAQYEYPAAPPAESVDAGARYHALLKLPDARRFRGHVVNTIPALPTGIVPLDVVNAANAGCDVLSWRGIPKLQQDDHLVIEVTLTRDVLGPRVRSYVRRLVGIPRSWPTRCLLTGSVARGVVAGVADDRFWISCIATTNLEAGENSQRLDDVLVDVVPLNIGGEFVSSRCRPVIVPHQTDAELVYVFVGLTCGRCLRLAFRGAGLVFEGQTVYGDHDECDGVPIVRMTISPDVSLLCALNAEGKASLYDQDQRTFLYSHRHSLGHTSAAGAVCDLNAAGVEDSESAMVDCLFCPLRYWIATASSNGVELFDLEWKEVLWSQSSCGRVTSLSWSHDGEVLYVGHADGTLQALTTAARFLSSNARDDISAIDDS